MIMKSKTRKSTAVIILSELSTNGANRRGVADIEPVWGQQSRAATQELLAIAAQLRRSMGYHNEGGIVWKYVLYFVYCSPQHFR